MSCTFTLHKYRLGKKSVRQHSQRKEVGEHSKDIISFAASIKKIKFKKANPIVRHINSKRAFRRLGLSVPSAAAKS